MNEGPISGLYLLVQTQHRKYQNSTLNLFKVNNDKHQDDISDVVLMCLLLTLNRVCTFFWYFHYWLWTTECRMGMALEYTVSLWTRVHRFENFIVGKKIRHVFLDGALWVESKNARIWSPRVELKEFERKS